MNISRIDKWSIEFDLQGYWLNHRKMDKNHHFITHHPNIPVYNGSNFHSKLLSLLHHKFGRWCVFLAIFGLVNVFINHSNWNYFQNKQKKLICWIFSRRVPFEWRTPFGYFMAFSCEIPPICYILLNVAFFMSFSFGTGVLMIAFSDDIKAQLSVFNEYNRWKKSEAETIQQFLELVEFHSIAKQLRKCQFIA